MHDYDSKTRRTIPIIHGACGDIYWSHGVLWANLWSSLLLCSKNHKLDIEPLKRQKLNTAPLPEKSQGEGEGEEKCVSFLHQIPTLIHLVHQLLGIYRARLPTIRMANACSVPMGIYQI